MSNLFPHVTLCYRNWSICVASLIHRQKKKSLSFSLLFALESKKTHMSSTISLRYFLYYVLWHYCVDCHLNWIWFRLWILKMITNTPTFHHKDYQRLSEEVQFYLWRGCGEGLQWSLPSWEGSLSIVSLYQFCRLQLTSGSHRHYPCTHSPGEKWGDSSWKKNKTE